MTVMLMRNNLSVAMVAMTGNTTTDTVDNIKKFDWNDRTQGHILGSVYYGVAFSGLPGGYFSSRYSAKYTCAVGMLLAAISSLLTPTAARIGYPVMIANRAIVGIGLGVIIPGLHGLLGKWCPPFERSRLANFTYAGFPIGTIVAMLVSGPLCDSTFLGGWPSVFYLAGFLGAAVFLVPAGYAGYWNRILTVALISLSMTCIGFCLSGYHTNSLDIAPRYSGVLYGYSSTLACSAGFIGPIIIGELLEAKEKHTAWLFVFCISAGVYTFGMIAFLVCGTAEEQAWGKEDKDERKTEDYDEISNE
ncbi:sialin-like [Glandiceps talaboti]